MAFKKHNLSQFHAPLSAAAVVRFGMGVGEGDRVARIFGALCIAAGVTALALG